MVFDPHSEEVRHTAAGHMRIALAICECNEQLARVAMTEHL
jgi:hypothetical protein